MIRFNSIYLTNFMSFKDTPLVYSQKGLTLVEGENLDHMYADSNLSGKTNLIVEALLWCLFEQGLKEKGPDGNTVSQYRKDHVVLHGEDECAVALEFSKDGSYYVVYRTKKRNGISDLSVRIDGNVLRGKSKAHTQEILNSVLGMSYTTAAQVLMFGQGTRRFTQAKDSERKQVLEELLNLGVFGDALKEVRSRKKELMADILDTENKLQVTDALVHQWWDFRNDAIHDFHKEEKKIKDWKKEIVLKKQSALDFVKATKSDMRERKRRLDKLNADIPVLEKKKEKLNKRREKLDKRMEPLSIEFEILSDRLENIVDEHVAKCPTCLQKLDKGHLTKVIKDTEKEKEKVLKSIELLVNLRTPIDASLSVVGDKLYKYIPELQQKTNLHNYDTQMLKNKTKEANEYGKLKPPQGEADHSRVDKAVERYKDAKEKEKNIEKELKVLNKKLADLEFWEVGFGNKGIKSLMLDSILPVLNAEANKYIHHLMDDIEIEFDTETETKGGETRDLFEVRVRSGESNGYHLASGGERRRIDFCISLALQSLLASTGSKSNIFILDEPFESVDESGIGELIDLLREYSRKQGVAVYCISHLSNLKPLFDDVVTVRRKNGISQVA